MWKIQAVKPWLVVVRVVSSVFKASFSNTITILFKFRKVFCSMSVILCWRSVLSRMFMRLMLASSKIIVNWVVFNISDPLLKVSSTIFEDTISCVQVQLCCIKCQQLCNARSIMSKVSSSSSRSVVSCSRSVILHSCDVMVSSLPSDSWTEYMCKDYTRKYGDSHNSQLRHSNAWVV